MNKAIYRLSLPHWATPAFGSPQRPPSLSPTKAPLLHMPSISFSQGPIGPNPLPCKTGRESTPKEVTGLLYTNAARNASTQSRRPRTAHTSGCHGGAGWKACAHKRSPTYAALQALSQRTRAAAQDKPLPQLHRPAGQHMRGIISLMHGSTLLPERNSILPSHKRDKSQTFSGYPYT